MSATSSATEKSRKRRASKIGEKSTDEPPSNGATDLADYFEFLAPNYICKNAIGILFSLTTKQLFSAHFITLYRQSITTKINWQSFLNRKRRSLKPNINSVRKCFIINRLIAEYEKDPCKFAQKTGELYEEMIERMKSVETSTWTLDHFYKQIEIWQNTQNQRRLFYDINDEENQTHSILTLKNAATKLCAQLLDSHRLCNDGNSYYNLQKLLSNCFIIIIQPSVPECVGATKYEKIAKNYSAKITTRILCILEPDLINNHFNISNVGVTLLPFDRTLDLKSEQQAALEWKTKLTIDMEDNQNLFLYAELNSIKLTRLSERNLRLLYSSKLCQLQFQIQIRGKHFYMNENVTLTSQLFGLCSHAQYYPEYVSEVLLHEVEQFYQPNNPDTQPSFLSNYICQYFTRVTGVEAKPHTSQYIANVLEAVYNQHKVPHKNSFSIYNSIVAKILSQIEMLIDYPFLSMMYHDNLFLGICNHQIDQQLHGSREQPRVLLRFNTLLTHQPNEHPSIRFIVHNGQLICSAFYTKTIIDEMCLLICETNCDRAKQIQLSIDQSNLSCFQFNLYFDENLRRLNKHISPINNSYQPFISVLWKIMRNESDQQQFQSNSPPINSRLTTQDLFSSTNSPSNLIQNQLRITNENSPISLDLLIQHLVEKLHDLLTGNSSSSSEIRSLSTLLSNLTNGNIEEQKRILLFAIDDYFRSKTHVDADSQTSPMITNESFFSFFEDS